jgi:hypothetical protein
MSQTDLFPPVEPKSLLVNMQLLTLCREILRAQRLIYQSKTPKLTSKIIIRESGGFEGTQTAHTIGTGMMRPSLAFQQRLRVMKQGPTTARLPLML